MKKIAFLVCLAGYLSFANGPIWSKTGHRVVGEIAQAYLNKNTRKALTKLLDGQSLAEAGTFADEIKADSLYRIFDPWHYVNIPPDKNYSEITPNPDGDLVVGIRTCIQVLKNKDTSEPDKIFYLKMLIHLMGDLHQPMHIGRLADKGGNDIQLQWFNRGTNLHRVWDSNMIDDYGMSYTELSENLPKISREQVKFIQMGSLLDWVAEGKDMASVIYESVSTGDKLYYRYSYVWWDTVELQLQKGGIRLAKVLNELF